MTRENVRDLHRGQDIKPSGMDCILNVMQSDWKVESAVATFAAIWRMDFRGTRLDILKRLPQWSRVDREMERWIESGQEVLSGLADGFVVRMG